MNLNVLKEEWKKDLKSHYEDEMGDFTVLVSSKKDKFYLKRKNYPRTLAVIGESSVILESEGISQLDELAPKIKFLYENFNLLNTLEILKP